MVTCVAVPPPIGTKASVGFVRAKTSSAVPSTKAITELHQQEIDISHYYKSFTYHSSHRDIEYAQMTKTIFTDTK